MKRALKSPIFNAVCISLFTGFYAVVFITRDFAPSFLFYDGDSLFWRKWSDFLTAGNLVHTAWGLTAATALVVALLLMRRRPHDEYHASILTYCIVAGAVLTLMAIGIFFSVILYEPNWFAGKFLLFIIVHWITIVFCNLVYVLLCRWR